MSFSFTNQMEENVDFQLRYPYHMHADKLRDAAATRTVLTGGLYTGTFDTLLQRAYREPFAFYLTESDRRYYSDQEYTLLRKVIEFEKKRIQAGQSIIDLDIDDETMEYLTLYKTQHNMTFEEAIVDILSKIISQPDVEQAGKN